MPPMAPGDAPRQSPAQDRIHSLEDPQLHGAEWPVVGRPQGPSPHCKLKPAVLAVLPACHLTCPSLNCAWDLLRAPRPGGQGTAHLSA